MTEAFDQFWRCPVCNAGVAMGDPAELHPPFCSWGHQRTEMEQTTLEGFMAVERDDGH
jgi:endogenous inhibitor of DNA gyrase (YacG/DUF329 family)